MTTQFSALTLQHPASWHAYLTSDGDDLPNNDGAFLTDQPINPACHQTPQAGATFVRCPGILEFPEGPGPGYVWVEAEVDDSARGHATRADFTIDGYHATETTARVSGSLGFPVGPDGLPVPFCNQHTNYAVQVTATAPTTTVQPSSVVITACFGSNTAADRRAFRAMLPTATIDTTPSQSVPVTGARQCTHTDLAMAHDEEGDSQSFIDEFMFTNIGHVTCRLSGFPRLQLVTALGIAATTVDYQRIGKGRTWYLRPGSSVHTSTQAQCNFDLKPTAMATTEQIYLDGIRTPFTDHPRNGGIPIYADGPDVREAPLMGD